MLEYTAQSRKFVQKHSLKYKNLEVEFNSSSSSILRHSPSQMFFKIGVFKIFASFTGKHLYWSLFLIKFIKNRLQHRCFNVKFAKFLRAYFSLEHLWWLVLYSVIALPLWAMTALFLKLEDSMVLQHIHFSTAISFLFVECLLPINEKFNPLSANPIKWLNTLKQFFSNLATNCLSVFDHFAKLTL